MKFSDFINEDLSDFDDGEGNYITPYGSIKKDRYDAIDNTFRKKNRERDPHNIYSKIVKEIDKMVDDGKFDKVIEPIVSHLDGYNEFTVHTYNQETFEWLHLYVNVYFKRGKRLPTSEVHKIKKEVSKLISTVKDTRILRIETKNYGPRKVITFSIIYNVKDNQ